MHPQIDYKRINHISGPVHEKYRKKLAQPIFDYLDANTASTANLVLDGTGPRLTMHLPYLNAMTRNRLNNFDNIFAFSGGIGAYCLYLAQTLGCLKNNIDFYISSIDRQARSSHRFSLLEIPKMIKRWTNGKSLYPRLCYMDLFEGIVSKEFLDCPIDALAPNFFPYFALPTMIRPVALSHENGFDRSTITFAEIMAAGMKIPKLYATAANLTTSQLGKAYDSTYAIGYRALRSKIVKSHDKIVILTTISQDKENHACTIDLSEGGNANYQRACDILSLLLNIPSKRYARDLKLAYL